jgi:hypothetical protein
MTNFIIDGTSLPFPKVDLVPLGSAPANKYTSAADWNKVCQALIDVQAFLRGNFKLFKTGDVSVFAEVSVSNGSPLYTAEKGSLAIDVDTPALYQNTDGASTWSAVGGGGSSSAVIFDAGATPNQNLIADRTGDTSTNDPTKTGIVNLGVASTASGDYATVSGGNGNTASGDRSTVVGGDANTATGVSSVAAGEFSTADGEGSIAMGRFAYANGIGAVALASGNVNSGDKAVALNEAVVNSGDKAMAVNEAVINGGISSFAANSAVIGTGDYSAAFGKATIGNQNYAFAEGDGDIHNTADYAHVEGYQTLIDGSVGGGCTAGHAEGMFSTAQGEGSHAEGYNAASRGLYSHAEGIDTFTNYAGAGADGAHAEGRLTQANGHYSHAEGYQTVATGQGSHAEGWQSEAIGNYAHASGIGAKPRMAGEWGHASGIYNNNYQPYAGCVVLRGNCDNDPILRFNGITGYGTDEFQLKTASTYLVSVFCTLISYDGFNTYARTYRFSMCVTTDSGNIARIAQIGTVESLGDAYDATFTLVPSVNGIDNNVRFTCTGFNPGSNTTVTARLDYATTPRY